MEWLEQNLRLAFPFADQVSDAVAAVFADALVSTPVSGVLTLSIFDPQGLTNAHVQIKSGSTIVLETGSAIVTAMGTYSVLEGTDAARDSSYRFILDTAAASLFPSLTAPVPFSIEACSFTGGVVSSLNGLAGDVTLSLPDYSQPVIGEQYVSLEFQAPADRVDCSTRDCRQVFTVNGVAADDAGSLVVSSDGCYRLIPFAGQLLLYNFCTPCLKCEDLEVVNTVLTTEAGYYYQLAAIYHDQFNRLQLGTAHANREITDVMSRGIPVPAPDGAPPGQTFGGMVDLGGRSFNRPYFSQLALSIINSTNYVVRVTLTVTLAPSAIATAWQHVPLSTTLQRFATHGEQIPSLPDPGLPGSITFDVNSQETVAVATEVHLDNLVTTAPAAGTWQVTADVEFLSGPTPLPATQTLTRLFQLGYIPAAPTVIS